MKTMLATLKSTSTKDGAGSFEAVLSMPTLDRDGEIVDARAFDPLPDHITIDIDHAMTVEKTIGSGTPAYDESGILRFKGTYASHPLAQMVRTLVDEGHIRTMSVAYMNSQYEIDPTDQRPHLRKAELLNAGIVGIPSNREALITASKSLVAEIAEATEPDLTKASTAIDETSTPDLTVKAAEEAVEQTPVPPARSPQVDVATAKARASAAAASLALLD